MERYLILDMSGGGWYVVGEKSTQEEAIQAAQKDVENRKDPNYKLFVAKIISLVGSEMAIKPYTKIFE